MALPNPYKQYRQNQVNTSHPGELTLLLYQGAVRFVKQAKQAIADGNVQKAHEYIVRVQDIVQELIVTLNMEIDLAKQLMPLYDYFNRRLIEANLKKDPAILSEIQSFFEEFQQVWAQALKSFKGSTEAAIK